MSISVAEPVVRVLVTGSAGHLGEALIRTLAAQGHMDVIGIDLKPSPYTTATGSIADETFVSRWMAGVDVVYHTATLHKPHVATHSKQAFIETNVSGTLALLEAAVSAGVRGFVFTSTTSVFGDAMRPAAGEPAAWVTEQTQPLPKNIYGVTKLAAEELCQLFHRKEGLNCVILRTSRFFPEEDDDRSRREQFTDANLKAIEFLYRRAEISDVVGAHLDAGAKTAEIGFGRYIVSATSPFEQEDLPQLNEHAMTVVEHRLPAAAEALRKLGWRMLPQIDRVYVNAAAREALNWQPRYDFERVLRLSLEGAGPLSRLAEEIGSKGYHEEQFVDGPYPVND